MQNTLFTLAENVLNWCAVTSNICSQIPVQYQQDSMRRVIVKLRFLLDPSFNFTKTKTYRAKDG